MGSACLGNDPFPASARPFIRRTLTAFCALMIAARKSAGLTQQALARRLVRPQSFVAKYEGGEQRLDVVEFVADLSHRSRSGQAAAESSGRQVDA